MKNVLIVGGSQGIGKAAAELISKEYTVFVQSRTRPDIEHVNWFETDATAEYEPVEVDELHGLVYCPGSIDLKPFNRFEIADFESHMQLNVYGFIKAVQSHLKPLRRAHNASVIGFSTVAVSTGMPFHSVVATAKSALEGLIRSLAAEYAPANIRFNAIAPSITDTGLAANLLADDKKRDASAGRHPLKRIGNPNEFAALIKFLLSDDASWITGQTLHVDGGMSTLNRL